MTAPSESSTTPGLPAAADASAWASINTIKVLAMDAVEKSQSGHPGTPMALAPAAYVLWSKFLRYDPATPDWADRDRFVLSCGHASMLLYSMLHLTGYEVSLEDIRQFRQWGSLTPGHPERGHTPGVEVTTGPLGQGVANSVGMAMAERFLAQRFNRPEFEVVDHRVWTFVSDGDLMEGIASEAASLAGHLRLGKLCLLYDDNRITIDGSTDLSFSEDVQKRFTAYGWKVLRVSSGNDLKALQRAYSAARRDSDRPTLIILRTEIADPAPTKKGTAAAHGAPLGAAEVKATKEILGWPQDPFHVPAEVTDHMAKAGRRAGREHKAWRKKFLAYSRAFPVEAAEFEQWMAGDLPIGWDATLPKFAGEKGLATRQASQAVIDAVAKALPNFLGGSADLAGSNGAVIKEGGDFTVEVAGRNIHWGIREHAMAAACNGMAAHGGVRPFAATFLIFADYLKPALRLSAVSRLPVIYIGTHDSIGVGEDGPTHQPIEQLATLRATPNVLVFRPADATETAECWRLALERKDGPSVLALTRQKLPVLDRSVLAPAAGVRQGAYVLKEASGLGPQASGLPKVILMATGSEVSVALGAADLLEKEGTPTRVVSMPSWELFAAQPQSYRDQVLPPAVTARVSMEAAATFGWDRWVGSAGRALGLDHFGASAPAERLYQEFGLTAARMAEVARAVLAGRVA